MIRQWIGERNQRRLNDIPRRYTVEASKSLPTFGI
jgi:hypothetical protein